MDYPKSVPGVGLVGGKFVDEDAELGRQGSLIPSEWGNAVTEEIANVIKDAGDAPDEGDLTQLQRAVRKIVSLVWPKASDEDVDGGVIDNKVVTPKKLRATFATQAEAEGGVNETKIMSPLRVFQIIRSGVATATEALSGVLRVGTQVEVNQGTDDSVAVTPKKLRGSLATQAEAEGGVNETKIMSPLRVFQIIRSGVATATEALSGVLRVGTQVEVNQGTDDSVAVTPKKLRGSLATQAEAEGGVNETKIMSPLRVFQIIRSGVATATETLSGVLRVGTQVEVDQGVSDAVAVTPRKLRAGFYISLGVNGCVTFPTWLGGLIVQWGTAGSTDLSGLVEIPVTFPIAYPSSATPVVIVSDDSLQELSYLGVRNRSKTGFRVVAREATTDAVAHNFPWFSIGW